MLTRGDVVFFSDNTSQRIKENLNSIIHPRTGKTAHQHALHILTRKDIIRNPQGELNPTESTIFRGPRKKSVQLVLERLRRRGHNTKQYQGVVILDDQPGIVHKGETSHFIYQFRKDLLLEHYIGTQQMLVQDLEDLVSEMEKASSPDQQKKAARFITSLLDLVNFKNRLFIITGLVENALQFSNNNSDLDFYSALRQLQWDNDYVYQPMNQPALNRRLLEGGLHTLQRAETQLGLFSPFPSLAAKRGALDVFLQAIPRDEGAMLSQVILGQPLQQTACAVLRFELLGKRD